MKNNKGFTLVEILTVIIIMGVLMIIAVPAVSKYISGSRESTYITSVNKYIDEAINEITALDYSVSNEKYTYYIPTKCLAVENEKNESPYGDFVKSYVVVTYNEGKNDFYYTGIDETGHGILLTYRDELSESAIKTDLKSIDVTIGVGNRDEIYIYSDSCTKARFKVAASSKISDRSKKTDVTTESTPGDYPEDTAIVCKPATTLHTVDCAATSDGCYAAGFTGSNKTITYGTKVYGNPKPGDAYDCKVTIDGGYTERFYYVGSEGSNSILIYDKNMNDQATYAYDSSNENWHGPQTAINYLPTTSEWNNPELIVPKTRQIIAENKSSSTSGGKLPGADIDHPKFDYTGKAARFLTAQEINSACGITVGSFKNGELDGCTWLLENIGQYDGSSDRYAYWLETPRSDTSNYIWCVYGQKRRVARCTANNSNAFMVRPVITVKTTSLG